MLQSMGCEELDTTQQLNNNKKKVNLVTVTPPWLGVKLYQLYSGQYFPQFQSFSSLMLVSQLLHKSNFIKTNPQSLYFSFNRTIQFIYTQCYYYFVLNVPLILGFLFLSNIVFFSSLFSFTFFWIDFLKTSFLFKPPLIQIVHILFLLFE